MEAEYKPVFIGWATLVSQIPIQLFMTVWCGGFFGGMAKSLPMFAESSAPLLFFGLAGFLGVPLFAYIGRKYNYQKTIYAVFDDRLEFEEGFLTLQKKIIKFKDVQEVNLRKGIIQRMCHLGTVRLSTPAAGGSQYTSPWSSSSRGAIDLKDLANADGAYEKIKQLVDKNNT